MPEYIVKVREVHVMDVVIEADSKEEAIAAVTDGDGEYQDDSLEYSHTLEAEDWTVEGPFGTCKFCGERIPLTGPNAAHFHDGSYVGDTCCWDERLRMSE